MASPAFMDLPASPPRSSTSRRLAYLWSLGVVALCTALAWVVRRPGHASPTVVIYMLGVVFVALRWGHGASALACLGSVLAFDYFFEIPAFTLMVSDWGSLLFFLSLLGVAQVVAELVDRLRLQVAKVETEQRRISALYALSQELSRAAAVPEVAEAALRQLELGLGVEARLWLGAGPGGWRAFPEGPGGPPTEGPSTLLPLTDSRGSLGLLEIREGAHPDDSMLQAFAAQIAMALGRALLAESAELSRLEVESERLRNTVLSAISHDLRTPLSAITGAASGLLLLQDSLEPTQQRDMLAMILGESERLTHLMTNLLEMSRLESGALRARKDWQPLGEVVGAAVLRLEQLHGRLPVKIDLPASLPLVPLDPVLVEQVLLNLVENALKHAPDSGPLELSARAEAHRVVVTLADRGPGVPETFREAVFEKFFRMPGRAADGGVGLGLAICRGMIRAQGGEIWVEAREGGGTRFCFSLPLDGRAPDGPQEEMENES